MKQPKILQSRLRHIWLIGAFFFVLFPSVASAASTVGNPALREQLEIVKETLENLSYQIAAQEQTLLDRIELAEVRLGLKLDKALAALNKEERNIKLSTNMCFGASVFSKLSGGAKLELGAGWPNIAWAKGVGVINWNAIGGGISVGNKICVKIPLYSVASDKNWINDSDFDTTEFDNLIGTIAQPSQFVVPFLANVYGQLMPSPEAVLITANNVSIAATGTDFMTGIVSSPNPAAFLNGLSMFGPVIGDSLVLQGVLPGLSSTLVSTVGNPVAAASAFGAMAIPIPGINNNSGINLFLDIIDPLGLLH